MILTIYLYTNIRGAIDTQGYVRADIQTYGWKEKEFCIGTYIFICIYNYTMFSTAEWLININIMNSLHRILQTDQAIFFAHLKGVHLIVFGRH